MTETPNRYAFKLLTHLGYTNYEKPVPISAADGHYIQSVGFSGGNYRLFENDIEAGRLQSSYGHLAIIALVEDSALMKLVLEASGVEGPYTLEQLDGGDPPYPKAAVWIIRGFSTSFTQIDTEHGYFQHVLYWAFEGDARAARELAELEADNL